MSPHLGAVGALATVPCPPATGPGRSAGRFLVETGRHDEVAIVETGRSFTYGELRRSAARLATGLLQLGVPPGARVGILSPNSFFWAASYLAALEGFVAVPLSDKLPAPEVGGLARRVRCAAVLLDRASRRRFGGELAGTPLLTDQCLDDERAEVEWPILPEPDLDSDALLLFTSGTTAAAKAVRLTHRNVIANTESIVSYLGLEASDRMLVVLPFHYCYGLSLLNTHLRVGGSVVLCNSFVFPEMAIDVMERERCTGLAGVPSNFQLLLRASTFASRELPDLRLIQQAGGKLPPVLVEELVACKPRAELFVMYGQTEATARLSYLPPELALTKPGSIGRGIPGVRLQVVDEHGDPVPPGVTGEIYARGENISPGYLDDPAQTADKFPGGLLRTGDLATVDEEGFIYIVDRRDDFIKSWGHRVSSQEIEGCVLRLPGLVSVAAVGVPDMDSGEAIMLAVTIRPGAELTEAEILRFARANLAKHKVPARVHLLEALPLNANGKVDKKKVREHVAALSRHQR